MATRYDDFDSFWEHFVRSHTRPRTQWMHTAGVALWCTGAATTLLRRSPWPFVAGSAAFAAFALGAHPLFEGNLPENTGQPLLGILGNFRMAWHTLRGTMAGEVERAMRDDPAST
ncbi:MAG: Mpo1-like protein [Minicystis sp.]